MYGDSTERVGSKFCSGADWLEMPWQYCQHSLVTKPIDTSAEKVSIFVYLMALGHRYNSKHIMVEVIEISEVEYCRPTKLQLHYIWSRYAYRYSISG